jgi:hypothetical protein
VDHENRWPRTTPEDLIRAPVVCEVERLELRAELLAETHIDCSPPWLAQQGRGNRASPRPLVSTPNSPGDIGP